MKQAYWIPGGALAAALSGHALLHLTALGNEVAFCVTAGCSLYQDLVIGGLSMWWIGTAAFGALVFLALLGAVPAGHLLAGLILLGDIFLLLLMALTSPCVSCLVVACFLPWPTGFSGGRCTGPTNARQSVRCCCMPGCCCSWSTRAR